MRIGTPHFFTRRDPFTPTASGDPGALQDLLAKTGKLGEVPVSAALAETIEEARDQLWVAIEGAGALAHMGYSAGIGTVDVERPPPPTVK